MTTSPVKLMPSTTVHKVYKHYKTYKGKVIIVDGSSIRSVIMEDERRSETEAKNDAEKWIIDRKREKKNDQIS